MRHREVDVEREKGRTNRDEGVRRDRYKQTDRKEEKRQREEERHREIYIYIYGDRANPLPCRLDVCRPSRSKTHLYCASLLTRRAAVFAMTTSRKDRA